MATLRRVEETAARLRYAHSPTGGWVFVVLGIAGLALSWNQLEGGALGGGLIFSGLFLLAGVSSALKRFELVLDFDRRRFRYSRGSVFGQESGDEPLDVVERVILEKDLDRKGGREVLDEWEVELDIRGWPRPVEVFESKSESPARAEAEDLARRLGVPLEERTGH